MTVGDGKASTWPGSARAPNVEAMILPATSTVACVSGYWTFVRDIYRIEHVERK